MAETTARHVAYGIIALCNHHGDLATNLKLQKLVYYAQAWWLALNDRLLFDDRLEAWVHGPVQPSLYHEFKGFGWKPIITEAKADVPMNVCKHLADVLRTYGSHTAQELEELTHTEDPWIIARGGLPPDAACTNPIDPEDMRRFYRGKLVAQA